MSKKGLNNLSYAVTHNSHGKTTKFCHHLCKLLWFETLQCSLVTFSTAEQLYFWQLQFIYCTVTLHEVIYSIWPVSCYCIIDILGHYWFTCETSCYRDIALQGWLRSTVGGTPVFGQRTDPVLRSACSRRVTTMSVNRLLQVSQLGQLSLSSFWGR